MLGDWLGLFEGDKLGEELGDELGDWLGLEDGDKLGDWLGLAEGACVLGDWLGLAEGACVVGDCVGLSEGDSVGLKEVGDALGLADGLEVGFEVGLGVNKPTGGILFGDAVGVSVKQFGVTQTYSPLAAGLPVDTVSPSLVLKWNSKKLLVMLSRPLTELINQQPS